MIKTKRVKPHHVDKGTEAFEIEYQTPKRTGTRRFGGYDARAKATAFAVELLQELQGN
jgi:hypothetical protein